MTSRTKVPAFKADASYALVAWVILVVVGSLMPGRIVGSWSAVVANLEAGASLAVHEPELGTAFERLVAFFPLGWLVWRASVAGFRRPWAFSCAAVSLFALVVELAQSLVDTRHARLTDFLLAMAFGWLGVGMGAWLGARPSPVRLRRLLLAGLVAGNAVLAVIVAESHFGADIKGWDCDFPLVVANESSGDRPWRGRIRGVAIYPRALAAHDVASLASVPLSSEGLRSRQDAGALMVYHFDRARARRLPQVLPKGPEIDLLLPQAGPRTWRLGGGALDVLAPSLIGGDRAPHELCTAILESGAFAVEVAVASADLSQGGPARIVSYSSGPYQRNFTLGQERGALVFRVRTPWNGPNGANLPLETRDGVLAGGWHHVVAVYGRGAARLFLDGAPVAPSLRYHQLIRVSEDRVVRLAVIAAVGFMVMGISAALLKACSSWSSEIGRAYLGAALMPTGLALLLGLQLGHDPDRLLIAAAAVGPAIGVLCLRSWGWLKGELRNWGV
jgi:VanZ like family/Concanavalin A-like lectin/glucanases superfamily